MKIAKDGLVVVGAMAVAAVLGARASAQTGFKWEGNLAGDIHEQMDTSWEATEIALPEHGLGGPRGQGNLEDDMVDTGATGGLPVHDGGSFFVDLDDDEDLVLTVGSKLDDDPIGVRPPRRARGPHVRLWGGTPGDAGGIVVSLDRPHRGQLSPRSGALISGTFDASGSFEADLPEVAGDAWVQGFTFSALGAKFTPVRRVGTEEEAPSFDETEISNAVRGALKAGDAGGKSSLHFYGAVRGGTLDGWFDMHVQVARPAKDTYVLSMDRALAEVAQIVEVGGAGEVTVLLYSQAEIVEAIEDLASLQAFANDASANLSAKRSALSGSVLPPRCGTMGLLGKKGLALMPSPTRYATRTVGEEELGAEVGAATQIGAGRGIKKNEVEPKGPRGTRFDGPVHDGGSILGENEVNAAAGQAFPASDPEKTVSKFN